MWFASVVVVAVAATALTLAQGSSNEKKVFSGGDLGFMVDSERTGVPTGHFVIRVNGNWVNVKESPGMSKLTQ